MQKDLLRKLCCGIVSHLEYILYIGVFCGLGCDVYLTFFASVLMTKTG